MSCTHVWRETGRIEPHIKGGVPHIFRRPFPAVQFVCCEACAQNGFRHLGGKIVYTWRREDE